MRKNFSKILVILFALPLVLFFVFEIRYYVLYNREKRSPNIFIHPENFTGWVLVDYGNSDCPDTYKVDVIFHEDTISAFKYVIDVDGHYCTRFIPEPGWGSDVYIREDAPNINLLQDPNTGQNRIWHEDRVLSAQGKIKFYYY